MVSYSIETGSRTKIYLFSAILAIVLSSNLVFFERYIGYSVVAPSALMIYCGLIALYDKFLWKWSIFAKLTDIPNINGTWVGTLRRESEDTDVTLIITQTWKKIDLILESELTTSETISATMFVENGARIRILWTYLVRSRTNLENVNFYVSVPGTASSEFALRIR